MTIKDGKPYPSRGAYFPGIIVKAEVYADWGARNETVPLADRLLRVEYHVEFAGDEQVFADYAAAVEWCLLKRRAA